MLQNDNDNEAGENQDEDAPSPEKEKLSRGALTSREMVKEESPSRSDRGSQESSIERPRNHSLPNMTWTEDTKAALDETDSIESLRDTDSPSNKNEGSWEYVLTRDFRGEVENYLALKKKKDQDKQQR